MDPQAFIRLSVDSLALRVLGTATKSELQTLSSPCSCEIRLRGFPVQSTSVPLISSPDLNPDPNSIASSFYLEESDLKALLAPGCFYGAQAYLEVSVFSGSRGSLSHCGVGVKSQRIGSFKLQVVPEWGEGKPAILFGGWVGIGKNKADSGKLGAELHLRVKLDPDPRYVFQFEDLTKLSPQVVQLRGSIKQPIFSCKFIRDRVPQIDPLSTYWSGSDANPDTESERRERKGWKVKIHDLSGSAVAAAFMTTPFVPSTGCDWVAKSNPGAWLIVRPDPCGPDSWQPWGKLEAWRDRGSVCCRFRLMPEEGEEELLVSETRISAEKGGEFLIDIIDRKVPERSPAVVVSPRSSGEFVVPGAIVGGFVMSCRVQRGGRPPVVQLAMRHVTCVEDAAVFVALAAAVDLSVEACRPFRRKVKRGSCHYSSS